MAVMKHENAQMHDDGSVPRSAPVRLGALESQVMDVLWDRGASTIREVITHLQTGLAYTTIATVLANLERKTLAQSSRDARSVRYSAGMTREQYAVVQMEHVLGTSRDRSASILQFVNSMPESDLELLRTYLQHRESTQTP